MGWHPPPMRPWQALARYVRGAANTRFGVMPSEKAVARVKGLNDEPVCRPCPPPATVGWSQQDAVTSTWIFGLVGFVGQPPSARFTCDPP